MKTLKPFAHKLASLQCRAWLPPALFLLALSSPFLFGYEQERGLIHDEMSAKNLVIAENLSSKHHFVMFTHQVLSSNGKTRYNPYNRFPIGGYALIKLAILPFGDDLSAKIYVARMLMLLFFAAAAVLAYLSLRRIASSRWIALTATLLAFSSPYILYYNDMISNEIMMDLFGVMLVFHGMVIFEQDGRFRQLIIKACAALLIGWHVYALLLPFIAFGLLRGLFTKDAPRNFYPPLICQLKHTALSLLRSRYLTLGVATLLFGVSMLTFNFTNEYFALQRETPLTELPSFVSMINRTGVDPSISERQHADYLSWTAFPDRQFYRIGAMFLPFAFSPSYVSERITSYKSLNTGAAARSFAILGIAVSGASLMGLLFIRRHRILLATLALSGFCWMLPMRYNTAFQYHNFEAVFYIGITLTLFTLILLLLRRLSGERLIAALYVGALLAFTLSALRMSQLNERSVESARFEVADYEAIRNMTDEGESIQYTYKVKGIERRTLWFYLAGRIIVYRHKQEGSRPPPDFVLTEMRIDGLSSLTPQNRKAFLYEGDDFHRHIDEIIELADDLLIQSEFDVHINSNTLIYVKDDCHRDAAIGDQFFVAVFPVNESDLPAERRQRGFDNLDFFFNDTSVWTGKRCVAIAPLPNYDIDRIHTGQFTQRADGSFENLWEGEFSLSNRLTEDHMRRIDQIIAQASIEPLIHSDFAVYLADNSLIYAKDDCTKDDIIDTFFLAVYPINQNVLSDDRRQHGSDSLAFQFRDQGIKRGERCIAIAPLPEYAIDHIHTGQYIDLPDGSFKHTWEWNGKIYMSE